MPPKVPTTLVLSRLRRITGEERRLRRVEDDRLDVVEVRCPVVVEIDDLVDR